MKKILPAVLGTVVEYYDYALYGFLAVELGKHFLPAADNALLKIFLIFASGTIAKPLGALFFSHIGDTKSRVFALRINMLGIAFPTLLIGLLPSYEEIGIVAPVLLLILRFFQGFFVGGEADGVAVYVFEHSNDKNPCFANSLIYSSYIGGILLASIVITLCSNLPNMWPVRMPYVIGGILGALTFFVRRKLTEPLCFKKSKVTNPIAGLISTLKNNGRGIFASILLCGAVGGTYHFYLVFLFNFLNGKLNIISNIEAKYLMMISVFIYLISSFFAGYIADRVGPFKIIKLGLILVGIFSVFQIFSLYYGNLDTFIFSVIPFALAFFHIPGNVLLAREFQSHERYRAMSIGHNLGSVLFSGTAPAIGILAYNYTNLPVAPFMYAFILLGLGALSLSLISKKQVFRIQNKVA